MLIGNTFVEETSADKLNGTKTKVRSFYFRAGQEKDQSLNQILPTESTRAGRSYHDTFIYKLPESDLLICIVCTVYSF